MNVVSAAVALALLVPAQPPTKSDPVDVKESVAKGLKWLADQQEPEGNWFGRANSAPTTTTAMAGLALLMEGSTPKTGTYAPNLRKAVEWMEKSAAANGSLVGTNRTDTARPMSAHAEALLFLACAYDVDDDPARRGRSAGYSIAPSGMPLPSRPHGADGGSPPAAPPTPTTRSPPSPCCTRCSPRAKWESKCARHHQ